MLGRLAEARALLAALPAACSRRAEMHAEVDAAVRQFQEARRVIREEPDASPEALTRAVQRVQGLHESHTLACAATALLRAEGLLRLGRLDDMARLVEELPRGWDGAAVVGGWVRLLHAYHGGDLEQVLDGCVVFGVSHTFCCVRRVDMRAASCRWWMPPPGTTRRCTALHPCPAPSSCERRSTGGRG